MINFLRVIFTPSCWIQNNPYCAAWDAELKRLVETEKFVFLNRHHAKIGKHTVWIANHPYASFSVDGCDIRPSRSTILRAMDKLRAEQFAAAPAAESGRQSGVSTPSETAK
jgi:hypothetical protein